MAKWTRELVIHKIQEYCKQGKTINYSAIVVYDEPLTGAARRLFGTWGNAIQEAGFDYMAIKKDAAKNKGKKPRGFWSESLIIDKIKERRESGLSLSPHKVQAEDSSLYAAASSYFKSWALSNILLFKVDEVIREVVERQENAYLLVKKIKEVALDYSIGIATVEEIQRLNVRRAELLAMKRAVESLRQPPDYVLVDGRDRIMPFTIPQKAIIHGDQLIASISAASILAKTTRDQLMDEYNSQYPVYGFNRHKGYGTPEHIKALDRYGPSPIHRMSYRPVAVARNKMDTVQLTIF